MNSVDQIYYDPGWPKKKKEVYCTCKQVEHAISLRAAS